MCGGRAAGLVLALLAALLSGSDAVAVTTSGYTVLQLNVCNSGASCTLPDTARQAAALITARRPSLVTINEVCASDLPTITALTGYAGAFAQSGAQTCLDEDDGNAGSPYGNALLFPAGTAVAAHRTVEYTAQSQATERRTLTCATGDGVTACVTHLTCDGVRPAEDLLVRAGQAAEMGEVVRGLARVGPTVLAGDWNLVAGGVPDAHAVVPDGMSRSDDGRVQHVTATDADFLDARVQVLPLPWTDHPALEVRYRIRATGF